jgi:membrane protein DedA with SNARE-associated domain
MRWLLPEGRQRKVEGLFARHGSKTVFVARFFVGVRIGVYAYAGQHGMRWWRFLLLDLLGAMISGPTSIFVGKFAAEKLADPAQAEAYARHLLEKGHQGIYVVLGGLLVLGLAHWLWTKRSERRALRKEAAEQQARVAQGLASAPREQAAAARDEP